jgi:hypothetical protein
VAGTRPAGCVGDGSVGRAGIGIFTSSGLTVTCAEDRGTRLRRMTISLLLTF